MNARVITDALHFLNAAMKPHNHSSYQRGGCGVFVVYGAVITKGQDFCAGYIDEDISVTSTRKCEAVSP
jgi:hypothetical protein